MESLTREEKMVLLWCINAFPPQMKRKKKLIIIILVIIMIIYGLIKIVGIFEFITAPKNQRNIAWSTNIKKIQ